MSPWPPPRSWASTPRRCCARSSATTPRAWRTCARGASWPNRSDGGAGGDLGRLQDPDVVAEGVPDAAVDSVEVLGRLLRELHAALLQGLGRLPAVAGEQGEPADGALADQLPDLLAGGLVVGRRTRLLQVDLMRGVAGHAHRQPARGAGLDVAALLQAELVDVEVEGLVLVEDKDRGDGDVVEHAADAIGRSASPLFQNCSVAWRPSKSRSAPPPAARSGGMTSATRPRSRGRCG